MWICLSKVGDYKLYPEDPGGFFPIGILSNAAVNLVGATDSN